MTERDAHKHTAVVVSERDGDTGRIGGFRRLLGYRTGVWRLDYAEIVMDIEPKHLNSLGYLHGGVYTTLLDAAFGHAVCFCVTDGNAREAVTVSLLTTYLAPAKAGLIMARGRVIGVEGRVATVTGDVVLPDGTLCARGQASFYYMAGSEKPEGVVKRPKWVKA
jgi:uncharacterized protein (TIGR00369 family)